MDAFTAGIHLTDVGLDGRLIPEIVSYRVIHLLVELCNEVIQSVLLIFLITCGTAQVISATSIILLGSSMNLFLTLLFSITVLQAVLIFSIVYGFAGEFYKASELSLQQLKRHACIQYKTKLVKKEKKFRETFLRSCQAQKVKFGLSNFIDKTTSQVFQLYCLDRIIDLLLLR